MMRRKILIMKVVLVILSGEGEKVGGDVDVILAIFSIDKEKAGCRFCSLLS